MKDGKKTYVGGVRLPLAVFQGGVGGKGLATAPRKRSEKARAKLPREKPGLGPVFGDGRAVVSKSGGSLRVPVSELGVTIIRGDNALLYYRFAARGKNRVLAADDVSLAHAKVISALAEIGVLATEKADRTAIWDKIHNASEDHNGLVATQPGYERSDVPRYFVYGDGGVIIGNPSINVFPMIKNPGGFERAGGLRVYERAVAPVIRNQAIPLTVFMVGLSEALKPFLRGAGFNDENMIIDLVGQSTTYKTALTSGVAGSIWGNPDRRDGYARRWNMTPQKIEEFFRDFNNHLLILDETNLAHDDPKKRGEIIANVVFRASSGMGRARTGEDVVSHSLTILTSSNDSMKQMLAASPEAQQALDVRLISFSMPKRKTKFFDRVPRKFSSVPEAMQSVFGVIARNYGLLARRLISNVLKRMNADHAGFISLLRAAMDDFIESAGFTARDADDLQYRRVQPFALAYATASIACETGTLRKRRWGNPKKTILRAWFRYGRTQLVTKGDSRFNAYMENSENVFIDLRDSPKPELSDDDLGRIAGFIYYGKNGALYLAVTKAAVEQKLGYNAAMLKELKAQGIVRSGKQGQQTKRCLRRVQGKEKRDAFYIFSIQGIPADIHFWKEATSTKLPRY